MPAGRVKWWTGIGNESMGYTAARTENGRADTCGDEAGHRRRTRIARKAF